MRRLLTITLLLAVTGASADPAPTLRIDPGRITVSGLSSGGHMAHQLHIAYSELFSGAAIIAGGPFGCARGSLATAFARCVRTSGGGLEPDEFVEEIRKASAQGLLADPQHLSNDRVWLFHGALDKTVAEDLSVTLEGVYRAFMPEGSIAYVSDIPAAHNFPTRDAGPACDVSESPFLGHCDYDAAGQLLQQLYPGLGAPHDAAVGPLTEVELPGGPDAGLQARAFLYVPASCAGGHEDCALHLVLHGCAQSVSQVGTTFIEKSGYLAWAEANRIVLAFPQVAAAAANPLACWDWWGYTGADYRYRNGPQMKRIADWVRQLAGIGPS